MKNARMLKAIVFGVMEGKARKERPCREWTDDIKEDLHTLRWKATDRAEWQRVVRHAVDTNGSPCPWNQRKRRDTSSMVANVLLERKIIEYIRAVLVLF